MDHREELPIDWPEFRSTRDPLELEAMTTEGRALANSRDQLHHKLQHVLVVATSSHNILVGLLREKEKRFSTAGKLGIFFAVTVVQIGVSLIVHALTKT